LARTSVGVGRRRSSLRPAGQHLADDVSGLLDREGPDEKGPPRLVEEALGRTSTPRSAAATPPSTNPRPSTIRNSDDLARSAAGKRRPGRANTAWNEATALSRGPEARFRDDDAADRDSSGKTHD